MRPSERLAAGEATVEPVDSAHSSDCVLKIVLITIKGFCDQGLERWEPSHGRKQPLLLANLRAKHNLWDTTHPARDSIPRTLVGCELHSPKSRRDDSIG